MSDIYICVDCGGSNTKIVFKTKTMHKPEYLMMPPQVEPISADKLKSYQERQGWIGNPAPEQQAWLLVGEKMFVVGAFASKFDPTDRISELKYENALYKVLAAIGVIVQKYKLSTKKLLNIELAILLPWNEYSDRQRFQKQIEKFLAGYSFRGQNIRATLTCFLCRPEGGGLVASRVREQGVAWLQERRLGVLMFGHRNTTALYFDRGELKSGDSPLIGFSTMLDQVIDMTSGLTRDNLAMAIFKGIQEASSEIYRIEQQGYSEKARTYHPNWEKLNAIKALASAKDLGLKEQEVIDIAKAIKIATVDYGEKITKWLTKVFSEPLDEVIISGGAAKFLEPELEQYFNCEPQIIREHHTNKKVRTSSYQQSDCNQAFTPIVWSAGIGNLVEKTFGLGTREDEEKALTFRLVDAYGLYDYIVAKVMEGSKNAQKSA
ncbi:MAG: ParM/StbA family protein [Phormidium sp.]